MVTRTFQVDRYLPRTWAQARVVARLDDDGRLRYREDRPLWGASAWEFVTVTVPADASSATVMSAVNAASRVGNVRTTSRLRSTRPGRATVIAWELGRGATPARAWGPSRATDQVFFARG